MLVVAQTSPKSAIFNVKNGNEGKEAGNSSSTNTTSLNGLMVIEANAFNFPSSIETEAPVSN